MRYHHNKPHLYFPLYGVTYVCNHPVYSKCTLYLENGLGLAIIQQRHNEETKVTWWSEIDEWLLNDLYLHPKFKEFFVSRAKESVDGLYPTVTVRQIMWALKMKPIKRDRWETYFDRKDI